VSQVVDHVLILTALHFHKTSRSEGIARSVLAQHHFILNGFYLTAPLYTDRTCINVNDCIRNCNSCTQVCENIR